MLIVLATACVQPTPLPAQLSHAVELNAPSKPVRFFLKRAAAPPRMGRFHDYVRDASIVGLLWAGGLGYVAGQRGADAAVLASSLDSALVSALEAATPRQGPVMSASFRSTGMTAGELARALRYRDDRRLQRRYDALAGLLVSVGLPLLVIGGAGVDSETIAESRRALGRATPRAVGEALDPVPGELVHKRRTETGYDTILWGYGNAIVDYLLYVGNDVPPDASS